MEPLFLEIGEKIWGQGVIQISTTPVGGGCISRTVKLSSSRGECLIKCNNSPFSEEMFQAEMTGLNLLDTSKSLKIPAPIQAGKTQNGTAWLALEWVEQGRKAENFWESLGKGLAQIHRQTEDFFGLDENNFIGSLPQSNQKHKTWPEFFGQERLLPQFLMAKQQGWFDKPAEKKFDSLLKRLPQLFPKEPPALLHGDLWSGNFMSGPKGEPVIFDPAVYFGNREMDLAMTRLFGGFDHRFYAAYQEVFPLEPEFYQRQDLCNLYPLLVHLNLFGSGYYAQVAAIINRYS